MKPRVVLANTDGNVYALCARCCEAARKAGWTHAQVTAFRDRVFSAPDYGAALRVMMEEFDVE